jgi:hypothetical protein
MFDEVADSIVVITGIGKLNMVKNIKLRNRTLIINPMLGHNQADRARFVAYDKT